jgi:hypothetical protein
MVNLLKKYLVSNSRGILATLLTSFLLLIAFLTYLKFIGIPRTEARNLFNQAQLLILQEKDSEAKDVLMQAYAIWPEEYIKQLQAQI